MIQSDCSKTPDILSKRTKAQEEELRGAFGGLNAAEEKPKPIIVEGRKKIINTVEDMHRGLIDYNARNQNLARDLKEANAEQPA